MVSSFKRGGGSAADALGEALTSGLDSAFDQAIGNFADQLSGLMSGREGVSASTVMSSGGNAALAAVGTIGASYVGGESSRGESVLGGAAAGAAYGAQTFGWIGAIVGAILGAIVGWVAYQEPILEVSSNASNINHGRVEGHAQSVFGEIFVGKDDLTLADNMQSQQLAEKIAEFDNTIASLLSAVEIEAARAALIDYDLNQTGHGLNPTEVLADRFQTIVQALEPTWVNFLGNIADLEARVNAFQGLRAMQDQVVSLDAMIDSLGGDPFAQIRFAINNLEEAVASSAATFESALTVADPIAIAEASAQFQQAIMRRYQAEIEMVRKLQEAIQQAEDSARDFNIAMAQRLSGVGGAVSVAGVIASDIPGLQASVGNAAGTDAAIANLERFLGAVDQWLNAARAEVEQWAAAARARINGLLAALDTEQGGLMQVAAERQAAEQAAAQAAAEAQNAANQAHIAALNEQLQLAQQWTGVLNAAQSALDQMQFGAANPASGFVRQDLLDARITALRGRLSTADESDRAGIASELISLLNQRLGAAGELLQRPSPEYLSVFNQTANEISGLRDLAQVQQDRAQQLQEEIATLQGQTVQAVGGVSDTLSYLSAAEADRLAAIEVERSALQAELIAVDAEAAARLAAIDEQARAYYLWAQSTGEALNAARHLELTTALNEITGGLDPESFIAARLAETTGLLEDIRDAIADFLEGLADVSALPGTGVAPGGGGGPIVPIDRPRDATDVPPIIVTNNVYVASGDPKAIAAAVDARMNATLPQFASRLKQELKVA